MLEELLRHRKLGNKKELGFVLFEGMVHSKSQKLRDLQAVCTSQLFSINQSFTGLIFLLKFLGFIELSGNSVIPDSKKFNPSNYADGDQYFSEDHFVNALFQRIKRDCILEIFTVDNVKYDQDRRQYYVLQNLIPDRFFPIRNLLLGVDYLLPDHEKPNRLYIRERSSNTFKRIVIELIANAHKNFRIKHSLEQLKQTLEEKAYKGKEAEEFVLQLERDRLAEHISIDDVKRISDEEVNAGYDIESFQDLESVAINRYIEVKSYSGNPVFYWSRNEVEVAEKYKQRYYLCLVDRSRIGNPDYRPAMIPNPYKYVFENRAWTKEPESWKIEIDNDELNK